MIMKIPGINRKRTGSGPNVTFEEGLLSMDCRACSRTASLGDEGCVRCITGTIDESGTPTRLIIRKESDTEYPVSVIHVLNELSKIGSLIKAASAERMTNRCKGCRSSIPYNAERMRDSFPGPRFEILRSEAERYNPGKEGCEECLRRTIGFIDRLETMFVTVRKEAAKKAFHLTEV